MATSDSTPTKTEALEDRAAVEDQATNNMLAKVISECAEPAPSASTSLKREGGLVAVAAAQDAAMAQMTSKAIEESVGRSVARSSGAKAQVSSSNSSGTTSSSSHYSDSEDGGGKSTATQRKTGPKIPSNKTSATWRAWQSSGARSSLQKCPRRPAHLLAKLLARPVFGMEWAATHARGAILR